MARAADELSCLTDEERKSAALYAQLRQEALVYLSQRDAAFAQLQSAGDLEAYQRRLREFFVRQLGGFPQRTPLEARTVRTIQADGYRIECVLFASQPGHQVTANLYLPAGAGPFPAVLVSSGHSRTGKTADYNQRYGIALVRQGIAALCYDPIGQGERSQILDDAGAPRFPGTTTEHTLLGVGSILVGRNTATYRVWDGMRAIDYLASRGEIDSRRIGMTGCSGGGTLTSYVMALDDRVACAAPSCYLTTLGRLLETLGPQDAEQNIFGQVAAGLDQPDYVLLRAPRPTLISATTSDFFDIRGTWENYRQAKRIYGLLGAPEKVDLVEVAGKHGVQPQNLASSVQWMQRWLLDKDAVVPTADIATRPPEELLCTEQGQVLRLPGQRSVFDLNAQHQASLAQRRAAFWKLGGPVGMTARIRQRIGVGPDDSLPTAQVESRGTVSRPGYQIEKLVLRVGQEVALPGLRFRPETPSGQHYLYLHDQGKAADAAPGGAIEALVHAGHTVLALDLRGQGETGSGSRDALLGDSRTFFLAYLLGKSLTGLRTLDVLAAAPRAAPQGAAQAAPAGNDRAKGSVHLVGVGQAGIVALHAAALRPEQFASVVLRGTPREWAAEVGKSVPAGLLDATVHGALETYDLPDLVRLAGEDKVRFEP